MDKIMGIYAIKNTVNGKLYIGSSKNIKVRIKTHLRLLDNGCHHSAHLQRAWNKYGFSKFEVYLLKEIKDQELLLTEEQNYINKYDSANSKYGYNIAPEANSVKGLAFTQEGYLFWVCKKFTGILNKDGFVVKMFHGISFPDKVSASDVGRLAILSQFIFEDTNMLAYRDNDGVHLMSFEYIGEVVYLKPRRARDFIAKMINLGVLAKVVTEDKKEVQFYMNPVYFYASNRLPLSLYLLFRKQLDLYLPDWAKDKFAEFIILQTKAKEEYTEDVANTRRGKMRRVV